MRTLLAVILLLICSFQVQPAYADKHAKCIVTLAGPVLEVMTLDGSQSYRLKYISGDKGFEFGDEVSLFSPDRKESGIVRFSGTKPLSGRVAVTKLPPAKKPKPK